MIERPCLIINILIEIARIWILTGSTGTLRRRGRLIPTARARVRDAEIFRFESACHAAPFCEDGARVATGLGGWDAGEVGGFEEGGAGEVVGFDEDDVGFGGRGDAETEVLVQAGGGDGLGGAGGFDLVDFGYEGCGEWGGEEGAGEEADELFDVVWRRRGLLGCWWEGACG